MPARPRIADRAGHAGANDIDFTIAVLKQEIREAVAIEITAGDQVQSRPQITQAATADYVGAVHHPKEDFAAIVLEEDVGFSAAGEIAGGNGVPARSGVADIEGPGHFPPLIPQMAISPLLF